MGRDGFMLPQAGWPIPFDPPQDTVDPAVALGIIRQESSFDTDAVSPAGARGLMQLMPGTAAAVARQLGATISLVALTFEPEQNMRLGTAYVRELLERYGGALPLAFAAYNAGPRRVDQWLAQYGDPRGVPAVGAFAGTVGSNPGSAAGGTPASTAGSTPTSATGSSPASTAGSNPTGSAGSGQASVAGGPPAGAAGGVPASGAGVVPATSPQTVCHPSRHRWRHPSRHARPT